jgi:hypothetical protein
MSDLISIENMERQISEMWDAVNNIPLHNNDRQGAIDQANKTEADLREMFRKQEALRNAAPEMLEALKTLLCGLENIDYVSDNEHVTYRTGFTKDVIEQAKKAIKKAEE